jgi:tellurite resistance protein
MSFFNRLSGPNMPPAEAGLIAAVAMLTLDSDMIDVERRMISLLRDQFTPLGALDDAAFEAALEKAITVAGQRGGVGDLTTFVRGPLGAAIATTADRLALYAYLYALAMCDLNLDANESQFLQIVRAEWALPPRDVEQTEQRILTEFRALHQAIAAAVLGLMAVSADGAVQNDEVANVRQQRTLLEPIAALDETQYGLVFDLGLNIHDRFLLDEENRKAFLESILAQMLTDRNVRMHAFAYASAVATSDGDISDQEMQMLKDLMGALQITDQDGEGIFNQYMARVRTINGKPR